VGFGIAGTDDRCSDAGHGNPAADCGVGLRGAGGGRGMSVGPFVGGVRDTRRATRSGFDLSGRGRRGIGRTSSPAA